jgi:putative photosynthetic complex assembly protein 2
LDHPLILALGAIFLWWFSTGTIMLAVRRADRAGGGAHGTVVFFTVPVLALGVLGVIVGAPGAGVGQVLAGFLGALAIWGWVETAFLCGVIAGPERRDCPPGLPPGARFMRAWGTVMHHEIALLTGLLALIAITSGAESRIALWTYLILFLARISAKLNLFLGVPRINFEFLPARLAHLASYMRRGLASFFYPLSVTLLSIATGFLIQAYLGAQTPVDRAAAALLATLAALALIEHWLMVVPLPDAKLWRWMLPAPAAPQDVTAEERSRP